MIMPTRFKRILQAASSCQNLPVQLFFSPPQVAWNQFAAPWPRAGLRCLASAGRPSRDEISRGREVRRRSSVRSVRLEEGPGSGNQWKLGDKKIQSYHPFQQKRSDDEH